VIHFALSNGVSVCRVDQPNWINAASKGVGGR